MIASAQSRRKSFGRAVGARYVVPAPGRGADMALTKQGPPCAQAGCERRPDFYSSCSDVHSTVLVCTISQNQQTVAEVRGGGRVFKGMANFAEERRAEAVRGTGMPGRKDSGGCDGCMPGQGRTVEV